MGLTLGNDAETPGASVVFYGPPGRYLAHMPTAVKGIFVGVVKIKRCPRHITLPGCLIPSAALGILLTAAPVVACHSSIVTYSAQGASVQERWANLLD